MSKKGEVPYWLAMLIYILVGLIVILALIGLASGKMGEFLNWLEGIF